MRGLYLITNDDPIELLLEKLEAALATRQIEILQYRRKKVNRADQPHEVERIKALCDYYQVILIINDDISLARQFGVGVHLGQSDGEITEAKQQLPKDVMIGRTCANSIELAEQAAGEGASYVAFGAIYTSSSKPEAGNIGLETLKTARQRLSLPMCAIGGLTVENAQPVIEAGADLCAVISDILALPAENIPARIQAWAILFAETQPVA